MAHPFEKMFDAALKKSTPELNVVEKEARKILEKGYRQEEICAVLLKLEKSLIDDREIEIIHDAYTSICGEDD